MTLPGMMLLLVIIAFYILLYLNEKCDTFDKNAIFFMVGVVSKHHCSRPAGGTGVDYSLP